MTLVAGQDERDRALLEEQVVAALSELIGEAHVVGHTQGLAAFVSDWVGEYRSDPLCLVFPGSTEDVSRILAWCHAHQIAVVPQGGNTGLVGGSQAERDVPSLLMNMRRMNQILDLDAANFTLVAQAGCIVEELRDAAAAKGRLFPLSFGAQGSAQIGGAVAVNAGGLNVVRYGMTRDLVLGLEAVMADGTVLNQLKVLRKDNRGVNLSQLLIGSEGTLGVITAVSVKLFPGQARRETIFVGLQDVRAALGVLDLARRLSADLLTAFELIPRACVDMALAHADALSDPMQDAYPWYALIEFDCSGDFDLRGMLDGFFSTAMTQDLIADGVLAESEAQRSRLWLIREAMVEAQIAKGLHLRSDISVPVSKIPDVIDAALAAFHKAEPAWVPLPYGHLGDGNLHFNAMPPKGLGEDTARQALQKLTALLYGLVDDLNGSISAEHGIGRARLSAHEARLSPAEIDLQRGLKALFDPKGILNPGCLVPRKQAGGTGG